MEVTMKTLSMRSPLFVFVILLMSVAGCDKKDVPDDVTEVITGGSWRVGHFMDNSGDETTDFIGYSLQFNESGTLSALKNGVTTSGTWSRDNSSNKIVIDLGPDDPSNEPLGDLTNDWKVNTFNNTQLSLFDDSNSSEMLVLLKN
jgi:hypothetical protein